MTKEDAIQEATETANRENLVMVVANDPISNAEDESGPWGYCPSNARFLLFRWAVETITICPS